MIKINNLDMINEYILKYDINNIFTKDMKPFMEMLFFEKNQFIFKEDEDIKYLIFLIKGKLKVYVTLSNGRSLLNCFCQDFKVFGDLEFINSQTAYSNVQAIVDTYCIGIPINKVREYLLNDAKFLKYICSELGEKLLKFSRNTSINLLYPLENRLASYILATGQKNHNNGRIEFNENLTEIAELLGASYRHLLRTLNMLCLKGSIEKKNGYYEIIDRGILEELAVGVYS